MGLTFEDAALAIDPRTAILRMLGAKCVTCGYNRSTFALVIWDTTGRGKEERTAAGYRQKYIAGVLAEIYNGGASRYEVVCMNCKTERMAEGRVRAHLARKGIDIVPGVVVWRLEENAPAELTIAHYAWADAYEEAGREVWIMWEGLMRRYKTKVQLTFGEFTERFGVDPTTLPEGTTELK